MLAVSILGVSMKNNFAVVVAPLDDERYIEAMARLDELQAQGFVVEQRNIVFCYDPMRKRDVPCAVYWVERKLKVEE